MILAVIAPTVQGKIASLKEYSLVTLIGADDSFSQPKVPTAEVRPLSEVIVILDRYGRLL
jgi:hypothetical protein